VRTFECPVSDRESFVQKLIVREGLPVPDVYGRADLMFTLAKVVKAEAREAFVFLPFDHVTEVAALGGRILINKKVDFTIGYQAPVFHRT